MKAIHNRVRPADDVPGVVIKEQRYDKWKQFTTTLLSRKRYGQLLSKSKDTINESNSQLQDRIFLSDFDKFLVALPFEGEESDITE